MSNLQESLKHFITQGPSRAIIGARQVNFDDISKDFEFDQWKGLDYMYDIEPQSQNLFYAGYFCEAGDGTQTNSEKMFYNAAFRIKKVSIPFPSMEMEFHPETRIPMVKGVSYANEISLDWFEDVYHSVQKYHLDWFNRWYTREYDCFRCGIKGKFRKMAVIAFHYVNTNSTSIVPVPKIEPLFAFIIAGLSPKTMPPMVFDYNSDANDQPLSMTYHCGPIRWLYGGKIGMGHHNDVNELFTGNNAHSLEKFSDTLDTNLSIPPQRSFEFEKGEGNDKDNWEKFRIVRAATFYQASEASL
jgi:hypothetical protein